jgi:hypothetical protein
MIHCVVYLLRIFKMFHGLMNNRVYWGMESVSWLRCMCIMNLCISSTATDNVIKALPVLCNYIMSLLFWTFVLTETWNVRMCLQFITWEMREGVVVTLYNCTWYLRSSVGVLYWKLEIVKGVALYWYIYVCVCVRVLVVFLTCEVGLRRVDYFSHAGFWCCHAITKLSTLWHSSALQ